MARAPKKNKELNDEAEEILEAPEAESALEEPYDEDVFDELDLQCGEALYTARTEQGLSVQEIAKQLRLSTPQVEALERDDFEQLPEATIVKGFIRNYAKLLKIPAEPLLDAYVQMAPKKEDYTFALNPGINMKITEGRKSHKLAYIIAALLMLLVVGVWFFYQSYVQKPSPVNPMPEVSEVLPEIELPTSEQIEDTSVTQLNMPAPPTTATTEMTETTAEEEAAAENAQAEAAESAEVTQEQAAAEVEAVDVAQTPPAPGKTRFEFTATQETWLSVVNTSGREVYNKILYPGDRDSVDVSYPAEVVVGNAHGTTLIVDGQSIDLAPYTRINVARYRFNR